MRSSRAATSTALSCRQRASAAWKPGRRSSLPLAMSLYSATSVQPWAAKARRLAADLIAAIKAEIIETGRFTLPDFGAFVVRETPKRTALNPRTGEKVAVKAGATVKFKASPSLKEAAFAGLKKARRKAKKD
jgi:DNA-binding protein HU-beta